MSAFVLDNSVTMRWFFDSGEHAYADRVLARLSSDGGEAFVPSIWRYEVSAVLARAQLKGIAPVLDIVEFIAELQNLPIELDDQSAFRVFPDVHDLATTYRLTSYDAAYLELASRRKLPLATLDADLVAACGRAGVLLV